jgi:hypothetical protein
VGSAVDKGADPAHIMVVLDSIDECPITTKVLLHNLEATLRQHPTYRVVLGCRTADWPETLDARLTALLPGLKVYELLPLGRADIAELAATRGADGAGFLAAVVDAAAPARGGLGHCRSRGCRKDPPLRSPDSRQSRAGVPAFRGMVARMPRCYSARTSASCALA